MIDRKRPPPGRGSRDARCSAVQRLLLHEGWSRTVVGHRRHDSRVNFASGACRASSPELRSQRRAQGWDVASYGLSGTLGPAAVAWIAATSDALTATLVLAGAAVVGAGAVLALPRQEPLDQAVDVPSPGRTLSLIWKRGPLRCPLGPTVTVAFSVARSFHKVRPSSGTDLRDVFKLA